MKKSEFWVLLLEGLTISIVSLLVGENYFYWFPVLLVLMGMIIVLCAGRFLGYGFPEIYLPPGEHFQKISEFRGKNNFIFLILKHAKDKIRYDEKIDDCVRRDDIRLYMIHADILLDRDGQKIKEIPEKFNAIISRRIVQGQELAKHPKFDKVYYIISG